MNKYVCYKCGGLIDDSHPLYIVDNRHFMCLDCALALGYIGPMAWLEAHGLGIYHHAEYHDGAITAFQKYGRGYRKDVITVYGLGI